MKFIAIAAIFATSGLASVCPTGLFSNALCCATSVLGVIGLDCNTGELPLPSLETVLDSNVIFSKMAR